MHKEITITNPLKTTDISLGQHMYTVSPLYLR